jgi:hypothetical protein
VSASEKLKALDAETNGDVGPPLANALPQIVAVVERAERAKVWLFNSPLEGALDEYDRIDRALAALDEALS